MKLRIVPFIASLACASIVGCAAPSASDSPEIAGSELVSPGEGSNDGTAIDAVNSYYEAYRAGDKEAIRARLANVLGDAVSLDSPLVIEKFHQPVVGKAGVVEFALVASALLKNAIVRGTYVDTKDAWTVATLIDVPTPCGPVPESEYFTVDAKTRRITRIYSNYDPRTLLALSATGKCPQPR